MIGQRFFVTALGALLPLSAWSWGRAGHASIASLAEVKLTPAAAAQVHELLQGDLDRLGQPSGRITLAQVASWPDEIRDEAVKTDPKAFKGQTPQARLTDTAPLAADTPT